MLNLKIMMENRGNMIKRNSKTYYGRETKKALENFQISGLHNKKILIYSIVSIKKAAAISNVFTRRLNKKIGNAIVRVCDETLKGKLDSQFLLDVFQAGAGTSTNMNINEVIANRATQILKRPVHPNDHVNMSQSTNDVFPSAVRIACLRLLPDLADNLAKLQISLNKKSKEFTKVLKSGRTHLQDAVPITLGQEFHAYSTSIKENITKIKHVSNVLKKLNLGGTAIGTGFNTHPRYRKIVLNHLRKITGLNLGSKEDLIEATQNSKDFLELSGVLRLAAVDLIRISNDLRLLNSGPKTGFNEIILPEVQFGSSIMPGKINPSIPEALNMICFQVIGNDLAILMATQAGQLELNIMNPAIAHNLLQSTEILANGIKMFNEKCIKGIKANKGLCNYYLENSMGTATALAPYIGYDKTAKIVKESLKTNKSIKYLIIKQKLLTKEQLKKILSYNNLTKPNLE
jgi:aspartate ammonia-lyase